jgi:hypothetical protein
MPAFSAASGRKPARQHFRAIPLADGPTSAVGRFQGFLFEDSFLQGLACFQGFILKDSFSKDTFKVFSKVATATKPRRCPRQTLARRPEGPMSEKRRSGGPGGRDRARVRRPKLLGHWRADSASDDRDLEIVEDGSDLRAAVQQERGRRRLQFTIARA